MPTSILRVVNLGTVGGVTGYDGLPPFGLCLTFELYIWKKKELYIWILTQLLPEVASSPSFPISHDRAEVSQLLSSACRPHSLLPIPAAPLYQETPAHFCAGLFKETHLRVGAPGYSRKHT